MTLTWNLIILIALVCMLIKIKIIEKKVEVKEMDEYKGFKCPNPQCTVVPSTFKTGQQKKAQDVITRPMICKVCGTVIWTVQVPTGKLEIKNEHLTPEELAGIEQAADEAAAMGGVQTASQVPPVVPPVAPAVSTAPGSLSTAPGAPPIVPAVVPPVTPPVVPPATETHPIPESSILAQPATLAALQNIPMGEVSGQMVRSFMDGTSVCVVRDTFVNHHDSKAGFGATAELAVADLLSNEAGT